MARRAKIVCTLGPATASPGRVRALVDAGMDVARLNFSHGSHDDHARAYRYVREASDAARRAVGVLADLQGPKIRLGRFCGGAVEWRTGDSVVITTEPVLGTRERVSTTYLRLPGDVGAGARLLVDDGNLVLQVEDVDGSDVRCRVIEGGPVSDHKGISLPGIAVSAPAFTEKDRADLAFALGLRVDMVALSFVRSPTDVHPVREALDAAEARLPVIAKVEKPEAVERLDEVVRAFDGIMVARGDLGVEMPQEQVPLVQKWACQLARENARPVIVATQMLESMVRAPRPTRAEVADVANAVLDGADAVMLSAESGVGEYPVEAVRTMARIVESVDCGWIDAAARGADQASHESGGDSHGSAGPTPLAAAAAAAGGRFAVPPLWHRPRTQGGAISLAAKEIGEVLGAKALVCFTQTGDTVRRMARYRSHLPLLAFTPLPAVRSQLALTWGVETFLIPVVTHTDEMVHQVQDMLLSLGRFRPGDVVVIVAGSPPGVSGSTNGVRVWRLGDELPNL